MKKSKKNESNMKKSKNIRYDKESKLWITHRKRVYVYWYKFLQIAIQENRKINRQFYGRWGNLNLKFDDWWKKNWKHLFAKWDGEDPLIKTSTDKVKADAYKHRLKVYELRKQGLSHKEIVEKINNTPKKGAAEPMGIQDEEHSRKYLQGAKRHLDNVCKGIFP